MAITTNDVKLLKSQRLADEDDGGGRATGQVVADAEINNLFPNTRRLVPGATRPNTTFSSSPLSVEFRGDQAHPASLGMLATRYFSDIKLKSAACTFVAACAFLYRKSDKVHVFPVTREEPRLHPPV
ncbi:hypothetical protein PSGK_15330 [Pseudomonas solani]|uniref:hypothetical protein n=1 Tax=Pseudomonas solani TaxID=2731552 RepID=UPI0035BE68B6